MQGVVAAEDVVVVCVADVEDVLTVAESGLIQGKPHVTLQPVLKVVREVAGVCVGQGQVDTGDSRYVS